MIETGEDVAMDDGRGFSPEKIADVLRRKIKAGALKGGERMPTQSALAEEFTVDRGTVRKALKALESDGLISKGGKGAPPKVSELASPASVAGIPRPTMAALAPHLMRAFEEPNVRIDVFSLTGETLMVALSEPLIRIHQGIFRPESIELRVVLPRADREMLYPAPLVGWGADDATDALIQKRALDQRTRQISVMVNGFQRLTIKNKISVKVSFREVATTPVEKLYLLNAKELLMGSYRFKKNAVEDGERVVELCDVGGAEAPLFLFTSEGAERDAAWVEDKQKWFDALWENVATELVTWPRDHVTTS
ncbi:winged helix-turn-helix domain-containing protein [Streptomyces sp. NPDC057717]|uniref:winged helix-turn-helix domain-containing protein n=1 Tax=Streptomyces sp. NPDC057717 TaxID=3346224 RepID=UPI00368B0029